MPKNAPQIKICETQRYGGEIIFYDSAVEDRVAIAQHLAQERGLVLIPPYDDVNIIAGQGTVALELIEHAPPLDILVVPLGGGGLLSGCAIAAKHHYPACRVIGVEPESGNDGQRSLQRQALVQLDKVPDTIADGARTLALGRLTFPLIQHYVDEIVTVSDAALIRTMRFLADKLKIVSEPTGALAAAAILEKSVEAKGKKVGVVISGGNVDPEQFATFLAQRS